MHNASPKEIAQVRAQAQEMVMLLQRVLKRLEGNMDKGSDIPKVTKALELLNQVDDVLQ